MDDEMAKRINRAAESILGNEKLTAYLDDDAAQALLDWGIACARKVVRRTIGMDDREVEAAIYQPMRATRRLMRAVNTWVSSHGTMGSQEKREALQKIIDQAVTVYGAGYAPPDGDEQEAFIEHSEAWSPQDPEFVAALRRFVENKTIL
jgi:hypothetical protein